MTSKAFSFKGLVLFLSRSLPKRFRSNIPASSPKKFNTGYCPSLVRQRSELGNQVLVFNVEGVMLRSSSLFPYFMLVAFEAGSLVRAVILFTLCPFICMLSKDMALKTMVFFSFVGLKRSNFRLGSAVLAKFFLEDVGLEAFEFVSRGKKKVGVSDLPQVMIESFLKEYLEIDVVAGRELKTFHGYFVGVMEDRKKINLDEIVSEDDDKSCLKVGITSSNHDIDPRWFSQCKDIKLVKEGYKRSWRSLPRQRYPKPLIFHDGRLAFRPTPINTLPMFMWLPFGLGILLIRAIVGFAAPYDVAIPILAFIGIRGEITNPKQRKENSKGLLYVCNHRTLLDPLFLSFGIKKSLTAVTYSLSRVSEILSPIKTIRLTRNRDEDASLMKKMLSQGDLVVCPEGTTCREPFLLRFSPLFTELNDEIAPIAMDCHVTMFYGTTASGFKWMDPFFFLLNPFPSYSIRFLDNVRGLTSDCGRDNNPSSRTKFDVANYVQSELGKALGFTCTKLTRKDKYLMLAGNEGIVSTGN